MNCVPTGRPAYNYARPNYLNKMVCSALSNNVCFLKILQSRYLKLVIDFWTALCMIMSVTMAAMFWLRQTYLQRGKQWRFTTIIGGIASPHSGHPTRWGHDVVADCVRTKPRLLRMATGVHPFVFRYLSLSDNICENPFLFFASCRKLFFNLQFMNAGAESTGTRSVSWHVHRSLLVMGKQYSVYLWVVDVLWERFELCADFDEERLPFVPRFTYSTKVFSGLFMTGI